MSKKSIIGGGEVGELSALSPQCKLNVRKSSWHHRELTPDLYVDQWKVNAEYPNNILIMFILSMR